MLTFTDWKNMFIAQSGAATSGALTQAVRNMNTGYHMFNAKFSRYYSRKQQFTNVKAGQSIYQTPIDSIRILGMTVKTAPGSNNYSPPIKEIRSEYEWRIIKTTPKYSSSWISYYFVLGNDEIEVWPVPSSDIAKGIRFYYQPQDFDLSIDDILSTSLSPAQTCSINNGDVTVTSTGATFTNQLPGLNFQLNGVTNLTWYEIVDAPTASTLTLKSAFVGNSGSGFNFRIGQLSIIPNEYQDVPVEYALGMFFSSKGNEARAQYHLGTPEKPGRFYSMIDDAIQEYSSSTEGSVITDDDNYINPWQITPLPGITS